MEAAQVLCMCAKKVSGITIRFQKERLIDEKLLISYDDLTESIMQFKDKGANISTRLFGFYLGLLAVTGLRNRTIREASFENFYKKTKR